jgi:hypothetical protein
MRTASAEDVVTVEYDGLTAVVEKNDGHPEGYLWIFIGPERRRFFLDVLVAGMTRANVRARARQFLQHYVSR